MSKKSKRASILFLSLIISILIFFNGNAVAKEQVNLRFMWWGGEARHKATLSAIDAYMKKYPYVKITAEYGGVTGYLQKLITQLVGKTAPDVVQIDVTWLGELFAQGDFFVDLKTVKGLNIKAFDQNFLNNWCYVGDKLVGLPTGVNCSVLQYNRDFFKKFGINENTVWTWDNLLETAEKVHKMDKNYYLLNFDPTVCYYMLKAYVLQKTGGNWINDDYTLGFDKNILTEAFEYMDKLFKVGGIQPFEESAPFHGKPEQNPKWIKGELGILWNWASTYPANKAVVPSLSLTLPPVHKNAKSTAIVVRPSQLFAVYKYSKYVNEAVKFINWLLNDREAALILGDVRGIPASSLARYALSKENKIDPVLSKVTNEAMKRAAKPENAISQNQEIEKISTDVIQELGYRQLTPAQAAEKLITLYEQRLAEIKRLQSTK